MSKLATELREELKGTNFIVLGDNSQVNRNVAKALAKAMRYAPIVTEDIVEALIKMPLADLVAEEGEGALGGVEYAVLQDAVYNLRCCIATAGGGIGATARGDMWPILFGAITVWLEDAAANPDAPQRECYRQAEIQIKVDNLAASQHDEAWVAETVKATLQATKQVLEQGAAGAAGGTLAGKKSLYLRLGARGDWPNLMPPGWDPDNPEVIPDVKMPPT